MVFNTQPVCLNDYILSYARFKTPWLLIVCYLLTPKHSHLHPRCKNTGRTPSTCCLRFSALSYSFSTLPYVLPNSVVPILRTKSFPPPPCVRRRLVSNRVSLLRIASKVIPFWVFSKCIFVNSQKHSHPPPATHNPVTKHFLFLLSTFSFSLSLSPSLDL